MREWIMRWGPAIIFMSVIFAFSAMPDRDLPEFGGWDYVAKKGAHMLGYALLASSYYYAISKGKSPTKQHFILALCLTALYAASDEWHQSFVPGRNPSLVDVGFDTIGGFIGITVFCVVRKYQYAQQAAANASPK